MLFGLHGFKTAGKDAFYQRALFMWPEKVSRVAFADKLYESAAGALGVTVDELLVWKNDPSMLITIETDWAEKPRQITFRQYLQFYGTEAHREVFGDSFWVDQVLGDEAYRWATDPDNLVCVTDCRFPNEAEAVRTKGGVVVKIIGPPEVEHRTDMHASENPLPDDLIDYYIDNSVRGDGFASLDKQIINLVAQVNTSLRVRRFSLADLGPSR